MKNAYLESLKTKIKKNPLSGIHAHADMTPKSRRKELENLDFDALTPKQAAVLCLIYPEAEELYFPLILRNAYPGVHSNQVSFPGGLFEKGDANFKHTAKRECEEEIGVNQNDINILRQLSDIYIPPSNFQVKSFIGYCDFTPNFYPQANEVAEIIKVKVKDLLDDASITHQLITTSYAHQIEVKAFKLNNHIVWGATAMILSEIKLLLKSL